MISLFYNLLLWVNIHPLKFSCAIDFSFLHAKKHLALLNHFFREGQVIPTAAPE